MGGEATEGIDKQCRKWKEREKKKSFT